uniref:Uncharacterized protein n=1 Tax=Avena sativa TaxID=4498 RepID=A0ACD5X5Y2_AVESA
MRNPLSSIAQGIHSASKILFVSGDDDLERLNKILARLEKLSPDIGEFIRLLHLEALPKVVRLHGSRKKKRRLRSNPSMRRTTSRHSLFSFSPLNEEKMEGLMAHDFCLSRTKEEKAKRVAREFCLPRIDEIEELPLVSDLECNSPVLWKEQQLKILQDRLLAAFTAICEAVELAGSRDLEDLQWLVYWTGILREAKKQGCAVLGAIDTKDNRSIVDCDQEKDELSGFVHRLEGLASDVVHFNKLVYLCRAC